MLTAEKNDKNKSTDSPFELLPSGEEDILCADIDLSTIYLIKQMTDVFGHHSRPDLLSLQVVDPEQVTTI